MNHRSILALTLLATACADTGDGNGGDTPAADAGPVKAECLQRDHTSDVEVDGETLTVMWPVDTLGPIAPGRGDTTELPDLSCLNEEPANQSTTLDTYACVDIFGPGDSVVGLEVSVWPDTGDDPSEQDPASGGKVVGCDQIEGDNEAHTAAIRTLCDDLCEFRGMVRLQGAPGGVPVVARVRAGDVNEDGNIDINDRLRMPFVDTWVYGVTLVPVEANGECAEACEGTCFRGTCVGADTSVLTAVAITEDSYSTIPIVSGVGRIDGDDDLLDGIGHGAIAGGIEDCQSQAIAGAAVASSGADPGTRTAYFQGDYPSPQKRATEGDATYVMLNHPPGPALIGAFVHNEMCDDDHVSDCICGGLSDAELTAERAGDQANLKLVGGRRVRVYPDSVTILSVREGLMP